MKLNRQHLPLLATAVARPSYDPAQLRQGMADRRLAAMQADRRARQVAFAHQGIEDQQQVEVELLQVQLHE